MEWYWKFHTFWHSSFISYIKYKYKNLSSMSEKENLILKFFRLAGKLDLRNLWSKWSRESYDETGHNLWMMNRKTKDYLRDAFIKKKCNICYTKVWPTPPFSRKCNKKLIHFFLILDPKKLFPLKSPQKKVKNPLKKSNYYTPGHNYAVCCCLETENRNEISTLNAENELFLNNWIWLLLYYNNFANASSK